MGFKNEELDYIKSIISKQYQTNKTNREKNSKEELRRAEIAAQTYKELILAHSSFCKECCCCLKEKCEICEANFPKVTLNCVICGKSLMEDIPALNAKLVSAPRKISKETLEDMKAFGIDVSEYEK